MVFPGAVADAGLELPALPYPKNALEPHISTRTVELHYEKHHRGYLDRVRSAVQNLPDKPSLESLISTARGDLFHWAAQAWNHTFYWRAMTPGGGGNPSASMESLLQRDFGSYSSFTSKFAEAANGVFGSGWGWLIMNKDRSLGVRSTQDAENPLRADCVPLLAIDVWEHAYYVDYQNERAKYVQAFIDHLINWDFAEARLQEASSLA